MALGFIRWTETETAWKKANITPIFTKGMEEAAGDCRLVSFTAAPGKTMEQILLEATTSIWRRRRWWRTSPTGVTKSKLCLTKLNAFYSEISVSIGSCWKFQRDLNSLETQTARALKKFSKDKCRVRSCRLESSFAEKGVGTKSCTWASSVPLWQRSPEASWAALGRALPVGHGRWSFPSVQTWWDTSGVLGSVLGTPVQERHGHAGDRFQKGLPSWWGTGARGYEGMLRELGLFRHQKRSLRGT